MDYDYLNYELQRHLEWESIVFHVAHELAAELYLDKRDRQEILDEAQEMGIDNDTLIELAKHFVPDEGEAS